MTADERAWCEQVQADAMEVFGICGLIDLRAPEGSKEKERGRRGALKALALAQAAKDRLNRANVADEAEQLAAGDYDLAALATAAPSTIED